MVVFVFCYGIIVVLLIKFGVCDNLFDSGEVWIYCDLNLGDLVLLLFSDVKNKFVNLFFGVGIYDVMWLWKFFVVYLIMMVFFDIVGFYFM